MLFIRICILNPYVNLNQNQSCQFQISSASNKCLLSCQFQNPTILSTSNFSYLFKFKLLPSCQVNFNLFLQYNSFPLNGQVASSRPRTACACQFTLVIGQVASSHPRTACTCQFVSVIGQVASSHPRTACTYPFGIRRAASSHPRTARAFYFVSCQPSN